MDRLARIVRWQWRAYWRRFSRTKNLALGHQGLTAIITVLILFTYVRLLGLASVDLAIGNTTLIQSLLAGIFLAWLFLPMSMSRDNISPRRLLLMPFSLNELLAIRITSLLITPYSWIVVAGSLAICYPLAHAPRPWAAITTALLFISMLCMTGLATAHLLNIAVWRKSLFALFVFLCAAAAFVVSGQDVARFTQFTWLLPTNFVASAAVGKNSLSLAIGSLLTLNVLSLAAAWLSFRQSLANEYEARSRRRLDSLLFHLPGAAGGLAAKDFRYFRRLLDPYFGVAATALCSLYLVISNAPSASVAWVFIVIVFIPNAPLAFNSFGLDMRSGLDRYALLPASGTTIMRGKNLAFLICTSIQVCPIILLVCWRFGLLVGTLTVVEATSLAATYLTWGNWMSISLPAKMQFFRFAPLRGSIPEIMAGVFVCSLPGILTIYLLQTKPTRAIFPALLVSMICGTLYFFVTILSGKRFEANREKLVSSIS